MRVSLASINAHAILDADDFDALMARGVSPNWSFSKKTVRAACPQLNTQRVARLIVNAPEGHAVRHRNRNGLDLRRENLFTVPIKRHPAPTLTGHHRPL
ncbi:hypothetical protein ASE63_25980 [Bosea sp. Root381]|uniref:hypothetical protein n=1 Tax=Bosea sp. Root381 TaxID=1736524 RepID=UPI0006FEE39E|nr:hypothetical protein [Bosea sp. Root381]KRE03561.1 hypothetical protein ASE63_25980 [Bosea sp. Root381]